MVNNYLAKEVTDLGGAFSSERIAYALEMTALGLIAVFSVLAIIWAVLSLFKVFSSDNSKKDVKEVKAKEENKAKVADVPTPVAIPQQTNGDEATVAAIMAAISAYIASDEKLSEEYSGGFRVVSFKRVRDKASWNAKNN